MNSLNPGRTGAAPKSVFRTLYRTTWWECMMKAILPPEPYQLPVSGTRTAELLMGRKKKAAKAAEPAPVRKRRNTGLPTVPKTNPTSEACICSPKRVSIRNEGIKAGKVAEGPVTYWYFSPLLLLDLLELFTLSYTFSNQLFLAPFLNQLGLSFSTYW